MPMKLGLSMFGALQTPDDQLAAFIPLSATLGEITVWRVWLIWYPPGEERSLIRANGALNEPMLSRLVNFLNFTKQYGIHVQLVGAPNVMEGGTTSANLSRYYDAWRTTMNALSAFDSGVWSTDLWNEESLRDDTSDAANPFPVSRRLYNITREQAPGKKITISESLGEEGGLSAVERMFLRWKFMRDAGIQLDYYSPHFQRQPPSSWAADNQDRFERMTRRLRGERNPGETAPAFELDPDPEVWDDEGAREGYEFAGDPSVEEHVQAAQGAENAGCYVHIFHTGANFAGQILSLVGGGVAGSTLSPTEVIKLQRIASEVIDDVLPPPPPGPPEPPPEPC